VLVAQDRRRVEVWSRVDSGWSHAVYAQGSQARLTSIDYALDIDELYDLAGLP
jgi:hypothetical protein